MSTEQRLGILLPEDGPPDYEWYTLDQSLDYQDGFLPALEIGKVASDGYHETRALTALGSVERLTPIGNDLVNRGANALVWACTSASFIGGLDWAEAQASELRRRLGMPVTSTSLAFRHALSTLEYYEVDVLSAYPDEVTECLIKFLHECDVRVRQASALDCAYAADSHELDIVGEVRAFAAKRKNTSAPLLLPDTAINTLSLTESLNREAGSSVITANEVSLWAGLNLLRWSHYPGCLAALPRGSGAKTSL